MLNFCQISKQCSGDDLKNSYAGRENRETQALYLVMEP